MSSFEAFVDEQLSSIYEQPSQHKRPRSSAGAADSDWGDIQPIVNAGGFRTHLIVKHCADLQFVREAYDLAQGRFLLSEEPVNIPQTALIPSAVLSAMFKPIPRTQLLSYQRVFSLPKANSNLSRLIGHPEALNNCLGAPHFRLMSFTELPEVFRIFQTHFFAVEFDFLNYFPQIPIGHKLSIYLGVISQNTAYAQTVLTQGWSCSTYIAQGFTWGFLRICSMRHGLSLSDYLFSQAPPSHVTSSDVTIIVVYDNVLILSADEAVSQKWNLAVAETAVYVNLRLKYVTCTKNRCVFVGQEFQFSESKIMWRTIPEKLDKWREPPSSARLPDALGHIAILIRQSQIRTRSLAGIPDVVKWLSLTTPRIVHRNWRKQPVDQDFYNLFAAHQDLLDATWTHLPKFTPSNPLVLACDATPTKTAYFTVLDNEEFSGGSISSWTDIAANEAFAILFGVTKFLRSNHDAIIVLSDNQPASQAIVKGYSSDVVLSHIASQMFKCNLPIVIYDVDTGLNIADFPSRNLSIDKDHPSWKKWQSFFGLAHSSQIITSKWLHRSTW